MMRTLTLFLILSLGLCIGWSPSALAQEGVTVEPAPPQPDPDAPPVRTRNPKNTIDEGPRWGIWRGELELPGSKQLSFNYVIEFLRDDESLPIWNITLRNGPESLPASIETTFPSVVITFPDTEARIEATLDVSGASMTGEYIYTRANESGDDVEYRLAFKGECSDSRRFAWIDPEWIPDEPIDTRWVVNFDERSGPAIAELRTLPDGMSVLGTVITPTGDDGQLAGTYEKGRLRLSRFTGATGLLYDGSIEPDGTLIGTFRSLAHHAEGFTASPDGDAALPDLFELTKWNEEVGLGDLTFRNFEGSEVNLADLAPNGEPRLVYIMGTWCHNCADATNYLSQLHERYAKEGLSIVGLAFEAPSEFAEQAENVRTYVLRKSVPFPILVAGQRNKDKATESLGALDKVRAFPTIAFVDADGRVLAVHQGFVGPAAPERHAQLRAQFTERIESMLSGK